MLGSNVATLPYKVGQHGELLRQLACENGVAPGRTKIRAYLHSEGIEISDRDSRQLAKCSQRVSANELD